MEEKDIEHFNKDLIDTVKRYFEGVDEHVFIHKPLIYCHFAHGVGEPCYFPVSDWEKLTRILTDSLEHYNELHAAMNLVLFEDAIQHILMVGDSFRLTQNSSYTRRSGMEWLHETEAHIDYEDNFPDDRSMPVAEHEEEPGKEEGEEEQEQEFSHPKETEAENVGSNKDVTQGIDSTEKGSKAPTESPVSLLSQKHLFWFPAESFSEPESDKDTNDATKTQFSDGNNHIGVKTIYNEPGNKMIYDSKDFPIGPVLVNNDTKAMKDTVTNTDESWLDGYPVTQEAVEDDEEEDKVDGSMGTEDDIILTTDQPNHVEVRKADNSNPAPDKDLTQIVAAPTRMRDYGIKEIPLVLTPTSAPENVSASKGSEDVIRYHPTTSLGFVTQESTTTTTQHDRSNLKTATLKTSTTVSPIDHIPYPETEETTAYSTQAATTIPTREVFTDSLSNEFLEQENLTYGTGEKLLPTSEPCVGEDCPSPNKDPMIAIIVIVLCLLLFASILAVWCFKKRQQKSSVYKLNGKGQARHPQHHQQIEMQKV
nr:sushi domain-containing protein 5 [Chrysemys picta bellii]